MRPPLGIKHWRNRTGEARHGWQGGVQWPQFGGKRQMIKVVRSMTSTNEDKTTPFWQPTYFYFNIMFAGEVTFLEIVKGLRDY